VQESLDMIAALKAAGGSPKYTEYPNGEHDIWDTAYTEPALLPWIFGQQKVIVPNTDGGPADAAGSGDANPASEAGGGDQLADASASTDARSVDAVSPADIATPLVVDGGASVSGDDGSASHAEPAADDAGCACRTTRQPIAPRGAPTLFLFSSLALVVRRRRLARRSSGTRAAARAPIGPTGA
jgi:hypothetical protein